MVPSVLTILVKQHLVLLPRQQNNIFWVNFLHWWHMIQIREHSQNSPLYHMLFSILDRQKLSLELTAQRMQRSKYPSLRTVRGRRKTSYLSYSCCILINDNQGDRKKQEKKKSAFWEQNISKPELRFLFRKSI